MNISLVWENARHQKPINSNRVKMIFVPSGRSFLTASYYNKQPPKFTSVPTVVLFTLSADKLAIINNKPHCDINGLTLSRFCYKNHDIYLT